jgi:hypothetical protein
MLDDQTKVLFEHRLSCLFTKIVAASLYRLCFQYSPPNSTVLPAVRLRGQTISALYNF